MLGFTQSLESMQAGCRDRPGWVSLAEQRGICTHCTPDYRLRAATSPLKKQVGLTETEATIMDSPQV